MAESGSNPEMDKAAEHAKHELIANAAQWDAVAVSRWWDKWHALAGEERLGQVLLELVRKKLLPDSLQPHLLGEPTISLKETAGRKRKERGPDSPLRKIARAKTFIRKAEGTVLRDIRFGLVKDEEGITERLIGAIHHQFNDHRHAGICWEAMTLRAHVRNAQETTFGADLLGVLRVRLQEYSVDKGFLAQAKFLRRSEPLNPSEFHRLKEQCAKMLPHSSASYVFLYEPDGITVVPAVTIVSLRDSTKLLDLKRYHLVEFFEDHFTCFVGDPALHTPSDGTLEELRKRVEARDALLLSGTSTQ